MIFRQYNKDDNYIEKGDVMSRRLFLGVFFVSTFILVRCVKSADLPPAASEPNQLVVVLMGDSQLFQQPETGDYVRIAMEDIRTLEHDFMVVLGDLVQNQAHLYEDYKELILDRATKPVYSLAGNADLNAGLETYKKATGVPLYYTIYKNGVRFIFLSVVSTSGYSSHICHLGTEQMAWLTNKLNADTRSTTVVFTHPPVFETTYGSGQTIPSGLPGPMYLYESAEMRRLLNSHPNVKLYANGHVHYRYGDTDNCGQDGWHQEGNVLFISVGATANNRGSSVLYITGDKITVKVRNHQARSWEPRYQYDYPVKTTYTLQDAPPQRAAGKK
jgi:3',5'-cyclic AMP phosphodiesterase CpdA